MIVIHTENRRKEMKKFLLIVIILIPIIVTVALNATGRLISMITPDNPTGIEIRSSLNQVIEKDDVIRVDIKDTSEFIMVDILPLMTKEDGINEPEKEENNVGDVDLVRQEGTNKYFVIPKKVGIVKIILSAIANVNVRRAVTFNVTSDSIENLTVYNSYGSDLQESENYLVNHSQQLYFDIFPIEALSNNMVTWKVSNGTSVEITPNGYLTIREKGLSVIRVMAKDRNADLITKDIIVDTAAAVVKQKVGYVEEGLASNQYVNENFALDPENSSTTLVGEGVYSVTYVDPLTQEELSDTIRIEEVKEDDWDFSDRPEILYTNNGPHFLKAVNLLTRDPQEDVTFTLDDSSMADYENETGALVPVKAGILNITAKYKNTEKSLKVTIREKVSSFELMLGSEDAKLGIQLTRKWGNYWFDEEGELTNKFNFGLYNKANLFDVVWNSSNPDVISIENVEGTQDVVLTFSEDGAGLSSVISADLIVNNRKVPGLRKSFEFKMMDTPDYVNVYNFEEMKELAFDEIYNACLQSDIMATHVLSMNVGISIFGNGFLFDGSQIPSLPLGVGAISIFREAYQWGRYGVQQLEGKTYTDTQSVEKDLTFEELRMSNAVSIEESPNRGSCFTIIAPWKGKIAFKYMQVRNAERGIEVVWAKDVSFEGCILGDNNTYSVFAVYPEFPHGAFGNERAKLAFKNNVIKHSDGPGVAFAYGNSIDAESLAKGFMPDILVDGFLDIYNWHTQESFERMFSKIVVQSLLAYTSATQEAVNIIDKMMVQAFKDNFGSPVLNNIYYWKDNKKYVSVGMMALGAIFRTEAEQIVCNDPRLTVLDVPMEDEKGVPLSSTVNALKTLLKSFMDLDKVTYSSALVCYDFQGGKEPAVKPGDPVPQDYQLYARLTGQSVNLYE